MKIEELIKEKQPGEYSKLKKRVHSRQKKEKLTEKEIKELMNHSSYRRGPGGCIRQVK